MLPSRFTTWLTINRACNLRCGWCYARSQGFDSEHNMTMETVLNSINLLTGLPVKDVILIGGEPTIHPQFFEIVRLLKQSEFQVSVITNGIAFSSESFLKKALKAGVSGITTSLKASSAGRYEKLTGRKVFPSIMKAIADIESSGIFHKVSITVCKDLFGDFDRMIDAVAQSKASRLSLDMERPVILDGRTYSPGSATPKEMADFFVEIYPRLESCGIEFDVKISVPFCLFPEGFIESIAEKDRIISGCQIFGGSGIIIDPHGKLLPCNHFCDHSLGEMGKDFWDAKSFYAFRRRDDVVNFYKTMSSCPSEACTECSRWEYCGAGCRMHWMYRDANELIPISAERR